jgi:hypothetical protein
VINKQGDILPWRLRTWDEHVMHIEEGKERAILYEATEQVMHTGRRLVGSIIS